VADTTGRSAERIFGPVDAMKLRSSMTLFEAADPAGAGHNVFGTVLARYFDGVPDEATLARLLRVTALRPGRPPRYSQVYATCRSPARRPDRRNPCASRPGRLETSCQLSRGRGKLAACHGQHRRSTATAYRPSPASARCSRRGWTFTARRCSPSAPG
ncbi:MAG: DUF1810 family protein, partial [Trebonia sp.]